MTFMKSSSGSHHPNTFKAAVAIYVNFTVEHIPSKKKKNLARVKKCAEVY